MSPFVGSVCLVAFTFAPRGWALCNGQQLLINQFTELFSVIGNTFGGNGTSTFALPNFPIVKDAGGASMTWIIALEGVLPTPS